MLKTAQQTSFTLGCFVITVLFTPPVRVNAGQIYTASYLASQGHYATDVNGMADWRGLITDPVYGPSNGAAGGNGIYRYARKGPSDSYRATNYYVDVIVTPESNPAGSVAAIANLVVDAARVQQHIDGMGSISASIAGKWRA